MARNHKRRKLRKRHSGPRRPYVSVSGWKKLRGLLTSSWSIVVGFSAVMTILGTIFAFSTRVSVLPEGPLNPVDPFLTPFVISNDSYLPISDVTYSFTVSDIRPNAFVDEIARGQEREGKTVGVSEISLRPGPQYAADYLNPNEKRTIRFLPVAGLLKSPITSASMEILITYRPLWVLWKQERRFRFNTERNNDGLLIWLPPRHY